MRMRNVYAAPVTAACGKQTWLGCGQHIETALSGVAEKDRCPNYKLSPPQRPACPPPAAPSSAEAAKSGAGGAAGSS